MRDTLVVHNLAGYDPDVGAALWRLEDTRRRTLRLLEGIPDAFVDQETGGNSVGTILYHVAVIEADWLYAEILEEPIPDDLIPLFPADARDEAGILTLVRGQTLDQHRARLRAVRDRLLQGLRGMTSDEFHRPRSLPDYDVSPAWVLHHLSQHEAEHRGELGAVVARLKGGG